MQPKAARNIPIEALCLVAVAGIAVFHTFQWTFQAVCVGAVEYAPLAMFLYSGVLGFINLLGCLMQSLSSSLWRPVFNTLLANILVSQNSPAVICIVTGTVISIVFALTLLTIDAVRSLIARKPKRQ